jgi:hypothetical protein
MNRKSRSDVIGAEPVEAPKHNPAKLAIESPMQELETMFANFVQSVDLAIQSSVDEQGKPRDLTGEEEHSLAETVGGYLETPAMVDSMVAMLMHRMLYEQLLRSGVKSAEARARSHAKFIKMAEDAIFLYMSERGIQSIEGFANRFKLYKKADALVVHNEDLVPEEYFDTFYTFRAPLQTADGLQTLKERAAELGLEFSSGSRSLNKERVISTLNQPNKSLPGLELMKDQKRLDWK